MSNFVSSDGSALVGGQLPSGIGQSLQLDGSGNLKTVGGGGGGGGGPVTAIAGAYADGALVTEGLTTDAAVTGDNPGTMSAKMRGMNKVWADIWDSVNHRIKVDGSGVTQPVSAASLPLPSGAATSAKQPAIGTAGVASADVITIQGIAGGTAIPISGSISATNPSVGTDGAAIPTSSTLIGASDGTNLQPLQVESTANKNLRIGIFNGVNQAAVSAANALKVDGSAVTQPVSGTFWQATQPVSAASLPLPTGASTAAKQPALGTAGAASTDVLSVQGIASMTALKTDGSGVTQPVSAVALPLPAGASTAAKQPALGTAGAASTDVISVQGIASMTALKVDGSGVTQPISGTITEANSAAILLDTADIEASLAPLTYDSTNQARVSLYGKNAAAGDTPVAVDATGRTKVDIDLITAALTQANQIPVSPARPQGKLTLSTAVLTANSDNSITFSGGGTVARLIRIQNDSTKRINWECDAAASTGSNFLEIPPANAVMVEYIPIQCTTFHIFSPTAGPTALNAAGGVFLEAWT